jgi:uncharacterized damage-inducible protein DinB
MSWVEHLRARIAYNEWANGKVFGAAATLSGEILGEDRPGTSYGALTKDLAHISRVQDWWCSVAADTGFIAEDPPSGPGVAPELTRRITESDARLRDLGASLTEESLEGTIERTRGNETFRWKQWRVIEHMLNHSSHHRAEIGQVLHGLGASPGDMDFIYFLDA